MTGDLESRVRSSLGAYADLVEDTRPPEFAAERQESVVRQWRAPLLVAAAAVLAVLGGVWLGSGNDGLFEPDITTLPATIEPAPDGARDPGETPETEPPPMSEPHAVMPASPEVGVPYAFELYTHCGIRGADIGGVWFAAEPPQVMPNASPPPGWGNPMQWGTLTLLSPDTAVFQDDVGHEVRFRAAPGSEPDPCA